MAQTPQQDIATHAQAAREGAKRMARAARDTGRALARLEAACATLGIQFIQEPTPKEQRHGEDRAV